MIIKKPWGYEDIFQDGPDRIIKKIYVNPGQKLSKQYHEYKEESMMYSSGKGIVYIESSSLPNVTHPHEFNNFSCFVHIPPKTIHRICADQHEFLEIIEVSTYHPKDVIRLADDYDRT